MEISRRAALAAGLATAIATPAAAATRYPFRVLRNRAFTAVQLNGKDPLPFMLDTGAGDFFITVAAAEAQRLGRFGKSMVQTAVGRTEMPIYRAQSMIIGGAVRESEVYLGGLPQELPDGLQGMVPTAKFGVMGFDFDSLEVLISRGMDFPTDGFLRLDTYVDERGSAGSVERLPGRDREQRALQDLRPVIDAEFDGQPLQLMFDTGADVGLFLRPDYVKSRGLWDHYPKAVESGLESLAGAHRARLARAQRLKIGNVTFANPVVLLGDPQDAQRDGGRKYDGLVGMEFLRRINFINDPNKRHLWLKPSKAVADGYRYDRAGAEIELTGGQMVATAVQPGSPAEKAGLREGDRITAWRGANGYYGLMWALQGAPGSKIDVQVEREGKPQMLSIVLEERV